MLMFNVVDLCLLAYNKVSIQEMYDIVLSVPKSLKDLGKLRDDPSAKMHNAFIRAHERATLYCQFLYKEWLKNLKETQQPLPASDAETIDKSQKAFPPLRTMRMVDQFFINNYITLSEKTRSIIEFSFSGFLFRLLQEPVYSLFCSNPSTITPEDCLDGKIILLNIPVKVYDKVGRDVQVMFKYIWQRAMEKRKIENNERPVFLWADEAQNFLHEHDVEYQATARSSRIATVYISQNIPNYYANMGGEKFEYRVKSFLGTLATKIFHANADIETNKYASELIGDAYFSDPSQSMSMGEKPSISRSISIKVERQVKPEQFVRLPTGGKVNNGRVKGYMHVQGTPMFNNENHSRITFTQTYTP